MDQRQQFTGGEPDVKLNQILFESIENRAGMFAMFDSFAVGTNPNFIIEGAAVVVGGVAPANTYTITAGYIYLNGEIIQVDAQNGSFDSGTEVLAYNKVQTNDSRGTKTFNDGTPRETWINNRGVVTVQATSILTTELDAINGETLRNKIERYVAGGIETFTNSDNTIANTTKYVIMNFAGPATYTLTIPDADDVLKYNNILIIDARYGGTADLDIEQEDTTSILSGIDSDAFIVLVNNGTTWTVLRDFREARSTTLTALTDNDTYVTPEGLGTINDGLRCKVVEIGDWNMDSTLVINVAHGLTLSDIRTIKVTIRNDADTFRRDLNYADITSGLTEGNYSCDGTNVGLARRTGGFFDAVDYDSTSYNRGWITIWYVA